MIASVSALIGAIVGIPSLRIKGLYLAIATLAGQLIIEWIINHTPAISGGAQASIQVPRPELWGHQMKTQGQLYFFLLDYQRGSFGVGAPTNAVLEIGGERLSLDKLTFDLHVDNDRDVIDTVVFHPSFARMPSDARNQVGFLALDWALGEDGVTRWIGGFETSGRRPPAGVPADGLIETVGALVGRAGQSRWALLRGVREGAIVLASLAVPAKWVDHPLMDLHLAVTLPFVGQTPEGLPGPGSLDQLRALEDELTDRLEPRALLVAHETTRGVRTLHLFADSDDSAVAEEARDAVAGWPGAAVNSTLDAGWRAIRHLTK